MYPHYSILYRHKQTSVSQHNKPVPCMVWSSVQRLTTHYPGGGLSFNDYLTIFKKLRVLVLDFQKDYARDF